MVKVCVSDLEQVTTLEWLLTKTHIPFEVCLNECDNGIATPYLLVDGVPLDFERSLKWLRGRYIHE